MESIGYWWWSVDPTRLVDPAWAAGEREALANYLRAGRTLHAYLGFSHCRFECGIPDREMGSRDLTDGTWVWPEGLPHYLTVHQIALPDEFLAHARANGFVVPDIPHATIEQARDEPVGDDKWHAWARQRRASWLDARSPPDR